MRRKKRLVRLPPAQEPEDDGERRQRHDVDRDGKLPIHPCVSPRVAGLAPGHGLEGFQVAAGSVELRLSLTAPDGRLVVLAPQRDLVILIDVRDGPGLRRIERTRAHAPAREGQSLSASS